MLGEILILLFCSVVHVSIGQSARNSLCYQMYRGECRTDCRRPEDDLGVPRAALFCGNGKCCGTARTPPVWFPWTSWSECSVTCGRGGQQRSRTCAFGNCTGQRRQFRSCTRVGCYLTVSTWEPWGTWTSCSASCGVGNRGRFRTCNGQTCQGVAFEINICNTRPCDGITTPNSTPRNPPTQPETEFTPRPPTDPPTEPTTDTEPTTPTTPSQSTASQARGGKRNCGSLSSMRSIGIGAAQSCTRNPWTVSFELAKVDTGRVAPICSGILLSSTDVLTTAICGTALQEMFEAFGWLAIAGSADGGIQERKVGTVTIFQNPNRATVRGDLAIVNIPDGFNENNCASPACLPDEADVFDMGDRCRITGWGLEGGIPDLNTNVSRAVQLEMNARLLSAGMCRNALVTAGSSQILLEDDVCIDSLGSERGLCEEDQGWMLVCDDNQGRATVVGVSTARSTCSTDRPSVFQGVKPHMEWIRQTLPNIFGPSESRGFLFSW